ncbi:unnamed protein product, partial [Rotaria sp. Silwood2]
LDVVNVDGIVDSGGIVGHDGATVYYVVMIGTTTTFNGYTNYNGSNNINVPPIPAPRRNLPPIPHYNN